MTTDPLETRHIPILSVHELVCAYHSKDGELPVLDNISFDAYEGEFLAIVGPSGCGKTTLLSVIAGLLPYDSGEITFSGQPVKQHGKHPIGYMLQKDHLLEWRSTYKNVMLGQEITLRKARHTHAKQVINKQKQQISEEAMQLLEIYGLSAFRNHPPSSLSGGMRQRTALIRTLLQKPELLLLDEPFSALDYQTRLTVADDLWRIIKKEHKTAVLITHDIAEAISLADRVLVLSHRPARIRADISIVLTLPEGETERSPFASRLSPEFSVYFNQIWKEMTA